MEYKQPSQAPIYTEHFDTTNEMRIFGLVIATCFALLLAYIFLFPGAKITDALFPAAVILVAACLVFFQSFFNRHIFVDYAADAITVRRGRRETRIAYSDIANAWFATYTVHKGTIWTDNKLAPDTGSLFFNSRKAKAEILVWNFMTSLGDNTKKHLVLKLANKDRLRILHTQNQEYVLSLLKKQAPNIRFLD